MDSLPADLTCTGVSFAHGSNDGQKGMGLIMLILIGILPTTFAVDLGTSQQSIDELAPTAQTISFQMDRHAPGVAMAGQQVAADELSAYLENHRNGAPTGPSPRSAPSAARSKRCWKAQRA